MNWQVFWFGAMAICYIAILIIWGYEDKKNYSIPGMYVVIGSTIYLLVYGIAFFENITFFTYFAIMGILLSIASYIIMRRQFKKLDHYVVTLGNLGMPMIAIPAFLGSVAFMAFSKRAKHPYVWIYSWNFIGIAIAELILLFILIPKY